MDISLPGLTQWTMQSATPDHPEIVVRTAPGHPVVEASCICQSFKLPIDRINSFVQVLRDVTRGKTITSASPSFSVMTCPEEMAVRLMDADGDDLMIHQLDADGFIEKLLAARALHEGD